MDKTTAVIRKKGDKYCVFSKSGKNLGCSDTMEGAKKRLQQVEFFKKAKSRGINRADPLDSVGREVDPEQKKRVTERFHRVLKERLGQSDAQDNPFRQPQKPTDGKTKTKKKKKRKKKSSTYSEVTMADGVKNPTESQMGGPDHVQSVEENRKVPDAKLPSLDNTGTREQVIARFEAATAAEQQALAENVAERIEKRIKKLQEAKKLADRLLKKGMTGEEFAKLMSFLQEEIVGDLAMQGVKASEQYKSRVLVEAVHLRRGK